MPRSLVLLTAALILLAAGCAGQSIQPTPTLPTIVFPTVRQLPASATPVPPTATIALVGSSTPTPLPTDENSLKPILRSDAESANQGTHAYDYACYAWAPCQCLVVVPNQIEIGFNFSARSVELQAGDYSQNFAWRTADAYTNKLGTLTTQLTFFKDGFELYTAIDNRACTQERYTLAPEGS